MCHAQGASLQIADVGNMSSQDVDASTFGCNQQRVTSPVSWRRAVALAGGNDTTVSWESSALSQYTILRWEPCRLSAM